MPTLTFSATVIENIQAESKARIIAIIEIIFNMSKVHFGFLVFINKKMRIQAQSPRENKIVIMTAIFSRLMITLYYLLFSGLLKREVNV